MDFDKKIKQILKGNHKKSTTFSFGNVMKAPKNSTKSFSNNFDKMFKMPKTSIATMKPMGTMKPFNMSMPKMNMRLPKSKDWDGDGVPNWKDCQPRNTMRQDKNLSSGDEAWIHSSHPLAGGRKVKIKRATDTPVGPFYYFEDTDKKNKPPWPGEFHGLDSSWFTKIKKSPTYTDNPNTGLSDDETKKLNARMTKAAIGWNQKVKDYNKQVDKGLFPDVPPPTNQFDSFGFEKDPYGREEEEAEYREDARREMQSIQDEYAPQQKVLKLTSAQRKRLDKHYDIGDVEEMEAELYDIFDKENEKQSDPASFVMPKNKYTQAIQERDQRDMEQEMYEMEMMEEDKQEQVDDDIYIN